MSILGIATLEEVVVRERATDDLILCTGPEAVDWIASGLGEATSIPPCEVLRHQTPERIHVNRVPRPR